MEQIYDNMNNYGNHISLHNYVWATAVDTIVSYIQTSGSTRNFLWRASRGQNAFLKGQKSKNLPKMADFDHFFSDGRSEPPTGLANVPHAPLMSPNVLFDFNWNLKFTSLKWLLFKLRLELTPFRKIILCTFNK